jgi:hypothetical protein
LDTPVRQTRVLEDEFGPGWIVGPIRPERAQATSAWANRPLPRSRSIASTAL